MPRSVECPFCHRVGSVPDDMSDADYQAVLYHPICPECAAKPLWELMGWSGTAGTTEVRAE